MRFAVIGAAGYIARKHVEVLHRLGHEVVAICDTHDNVGYIEGFYPQARFFKREGEFFAFCREGADWVVVCTPNYLHSRHVMNAAKSGCRVICEKPVVCSLEEYDTLVQFLTERNATCYCLLQLRHTILPEVRRLLAGHGSARMHYCTPRGLWFQDSWKGDASRSGGLLWNIGIHPFDLLSAAVESYEHVEATIITNTPSRHTGSMTIGNLDVAWTLSTERTDGRRRELDIGGHVVSLLPDDPLAPHVMSYKAILSGSGVRIDAIRKTIALIEKLNAE